MEGEEGEGEENGVGAENQRGSIEGEDEEAFHGFPLSPEVSSGATKPTNSTVLQADPAEPSIPRDSPTRDLVLAAITVMKGRKARPDTRRLCNWVHRKYGRPVQVRLSLGQSRTPRPVDWHLLQFHFCLVVQPIQPIPAKCSESSPRRWCRR